MNHTKSKHSKKGCKKKMLKGCVEKGRLRVVRRGGERMRKISPPAQQLYTLLCN